jgi:hypothetical protein
MQQEYLEQVCAAFSSKYVREVFQSILQSLDLALKIDAAILDTEKQLDQKEGELRHWASQD